MRVFDCQHFPGDIKEKFFKWSTNHHIGYHNDCCIEIDLHYFHEAPSKEEYLKAYDYPYEVLDYLRPFTEPNSKIIIKHWW